MKEKDNASSESSQPPGEQAPSTTNDEQQQQEQVQLTEVKNANASGLGSIGRSDEPAGEEGEGKEY